MTQENYYCEAVVGDGRQTGFPDTAFAFDFSNSTIEHVGPGADQKALANEMCRVGKAIYCQTPNKWFPLKVHYLTLFRTGDRSCCEIISSRDS
jgi:hypothetical protein